MVDRQPAVSTPQKTALKCLSVRTASAALCSTALNELVMTQAITDWTLCLEEAEMSLEIVRVKKEEKTRRGRERVTERDIKAEGWELN